MNILKTYLNMNSILTCLKKYNDLEIEKITVLDLREELNELNNIIKN